MAGMLRMVVVILVVLIGMTVAGCGGTGGNEGGGGNEAGGGEAGSDDQSGGSVPDSASEQAERMPDIEGTWVGGGKDDDGTLMIYLEQDAGSIAGYGTAAIRGDESPVYLHNLSGKLTPDGRLSVAENLNGETTVEPFSFEGRVTGFETMDYWAMGLNESDSTELSLLPTDYPEGMAIAAVQSVYSRDWVWFADHASDDVEDSLAVDFEDEVEPDEYYDGLTQMVSMQYESEMNYADEDDEPAMGARVTLDEESVVTNETSSGNISVEFDFSTSDGRGGDAFVSLRQAGTSASSFNFQIDKFEMDYEVEGATYDMTMTY